MTLSLSRRNRNMASAALLGTLANQYGPPAARALGNYVGRTVSSLFNGVEQSPGTNFTGQPNGSGRQFLTMGPSRSRRRQKSKRGRSKRQGPGRSVRTEQSMRVTLRDIIQLKNTSSGVLNQYYQLATSGTASHDLGAIFTQALTSLKGLFQTVTSHRMTISWLPSLPYTVGGQICMGMDGNTAITAPNAYPIRHDPSVLADVKENMVMTWTPRSQAEQASKFTDATASHTIDTCAPCVFQIYSANSQADTTTVIGSLVFEWDATWSEFF